MKEIKDYIHLYLGCQIQIIKATHHFVTELFIMDGDVVKLTPKILHRLEGGAIVKPVLRPLSSITEDQMVEIFKKISLFDLSECQFEHGADDKECKWVNAIMGGSVIDCIEYDGHLFYTMNNDGTFDPINPQWEVTVILLKMGFDLFNLIYRDLAIDSTTIKPAT